MTKLLKAELALYRTAISRIDESVAFGDVDPNHIWTILSELSEGVDDLHADRFIVTAAGRKAMREGNLPDTANRDAVRGSLANIKGGRW